MKTEQFRLRFALVTTFVAHVLAMVNEADSEDAFLFIENLILIPDCFW